jgi:hypothetical protein
MNVSSVHRVLAVFLVLGILVTGGLASAQSISHEFHHSHHQKSTHSTIFCSWMCAAGIAAETDPPAISSSLADSGLVAVQQEVLGEYVLRSVLHPRAPPVLSL